MLIPQPPPSKKALALAVKPQLHTHKNHHTYNGAHQLPQSTHVRVIPDQPTTNNGTNRTSTTRKSRKTKTKTDPPTPRYAITLHYAHNRACELYRTAHDMDILRRALGLLAHPIPPSKAEGSSSSSGTKTGKERGKGKEKGKGKGGEATTTTTVLGGAREGEGEGGSSPACKRTCSCPCACAETQKGCKAREAAGVQQMLGQALKRMEAGDTRVGVPMEWFLRRRMRDCGGR